MRTIIPALLVFLAITGCSQPLELERPASFHNPDDLQKLVHVASVEVTPARGESTRQLIHILDYHFVPRDAFEADFHTQEPTVTENDIEREWGAFLSDVEAVQEEQIDLLIELRKFHGIKAVYLEGVTEAKAKEVPAMAEKILGWQDRGGDDAMSEFLRHMNREHRLELGAAARVDGLEVRAAENAESLKAANPVRGGKVAYDSVAKERRENAIVQNVLAGSEPVVALILGGGHNLKDNVPEGVEVVRVAVKDFLVTEDQ